MLGFHSISEAPISALRRTVAAAAVVVRAVQNTGGWILRSGKKKQWVVKVGKKEHRFDELQDAWDFYDNTQVKRVRKLGKAAILYEEKPLTQIKIANTNAFEVLQSQRRIEILDRLIRKKVEKEFELRREEEEFILLIMAI